jgi:cobalt-zinc-cadmium efflux system outer membrane protein
MPGWTVRSRRPGGWRLALATVLLLAAFPLAADPGTGKGAVDPAYPRRAADPALALPAEVDLDAVLRLAREASPRLAAEREAVAAAEARRVTAGLLPNPRISLSQGRRATAAQTLFEGRSATDARVEFPLLLAGQRGARVDAAQRWIDTARARLALGGSVLAEEAAVAYVAALGSRARLATLDGALERIDRIAAVVAGREASGLASRFDVARVEVERAALRARREGELAEAGDALGALVVLLGFRGWTPVLRGALEPIALDGRWLVGRAPADAAHPAVEAARREEAASEAAVEVARRERWPVPAVGIGRSFTSEPYGAANMLGLSVEIPVFDQRRGVLAEAQAEARAARARRELAEAQTDATRARYAAVLRQRQEALARFDREAGDRLPSLERMAEDAYRLGRSSLLEWLDATRTLYEQRLARSDLLIAAAEAQLRLRAARGGFGEATGDPSR